LLFATDFQPATNHAAQVAAYLTKAFDMQTTALHVVDSSLPDVIRRIRQAEGASMLEDLKLHFARLETPLAGVAVAVNPIADAIVQKATEINADVIVLGAGILGAQRAFAVGPIAQAVMEQAAQPVLLAHPETRDAAFQTILCPVDHSAVSLRGLRNAVRLAQVFNSRLVIISVIPAVSWLTAAAETGSFTDAKSEYEDRWREELELFLARIALDEVKYTKVLRSGNPDEQIVATANEHGADLIVMGATGRTGIVRVLLGSTTRRVLRNLPCSLLTVKHDDIVEELLEDDLHTIASFLAEGQALHQSGSYEQAAAKLRQALARNPFHLHAVVRLAETLEKLGDDQEARRYRRRAELLGRQM
jgi:nucleotide-binding universal stress UspA family protein